MIRHSAVVRRPAPQVPPLPTTRRRVVPAVAVLTIAAVALTGCNSGAGAEGDAPAPPQAATASASSIDPCGILDRDELTSAIGAELTQTGPAFASSRGSECEWTFPAETAPGTLSITAWDGQEFFSSAIGEPLDGLADEARIDPGLGVLLFRQGAHVIQVQVLPTAQSGATQDIARQLAAAL